jgi:aminopeptidase N
MMGAMDDGTDATPAAPDPAAPGAAPPTRDPIPTTADPIPAARSRRWRDLGVLAFALVAVSALVTSSDISGAREISGTAAPGTTTGGPETGGPQAQAPGAGAAGAGDPYYPNDGNGGYDVDGYRVAVTYDPAQRHLDGDTTITARATQALSRFNLDLYKLTVHSVEVDGQPATFERDGQHELVVTPAEPMNKDDTFQVRVRYDGSPSLFDERGVGAGGWYANSSGAAVAAGEPHSSPAWYPSNDTPRDKATFELTARVPDGWTVISNGRELPTTSADGWTTFHWKLGTPTTTYLTTVAIDKWKVERSTLSDGTPVVSAYPPNSNSGVSDQRRLPEILEFLASKFGPYPFEAAGGIFLGASIGYALETASRPVYSPDPGLITIVHENAHQWFGDSVSIANWADICLNECFASYAQWLWQEEKNGTDLDARYRDEVDTVNFGSKLYDMGRGNEFRGVYTKGPVALHALRRQIGDDAFFSVLREWQSRHRGGNASWPEFEALTEELSGQDLDGFFTAWFHDGGRPADQYLWPGPLRP